MEITGLVIQEQKNYYIVDTGTCGSVRAVCKGIIKRECKRIFVGDTVCMELYSQTNNSNEAVIRSVSPRKNQVSKPPVANIDNLFFITTYRSPEIKEEFWDKYICYAELLHIPITIIINKIDLLTASQLALVQTRISYYEKMGYSVLCVSAYTGHGIDTIIAKAQSKISICTGASGVGKSTLLSKIFPHISFSTKEISAHSQRGKHTTTTVQLISINENSYIADTPGFSQFILPYIQPGDIMLYFNDMAPYLGTCQYSMCMHDQEPGCEIKKRVSANGILHSRYESYLTILHQMQTRKKEQYE